MKQSKNNTVRRIVSLSVAVCLIVVLLLNPFSSTTIQAAAALKEEVVYVRLNSDGSVNEIYVVNSFTLNERLEIIDYGNYAYVQNLSNMDILRLKDGIVTIDTQDDKLYYEGFLLDAQLPWEFSITYKLDGRTTTADEIGGKNGHFEMTIATDFNKEGNQEYYDRYCLQISVSLDAEICRNIEAGSGTIAAAGGNRQITYVVLPGKHTILELSADVVDFAMPSITIAGVIMNMDFDFDDVDLSDIQDLIDGLIELDDGVQELLDGIFDLNDGVEELYDGSIEFADGMEEFLEGIEELKDGVDELNEGVLELADGTEELKDGVEELKDGVVEMADGMGEMVDGIDELVDGVREFDDGIIELKDGVVELQDGVKELLDGTEKLYDGFLKIIDGAKELDEGLSDFATGAGSAPGGGVQLYDGFSAYFDVLLQMANAQLSANATISSLPQLTQENYASVLTGLVSQPALAAARQLFTAQVEYATRAEILIGFLQFWQLNFTVDQYLALPSDNPYRLLIDPLVDQQMASSSVIAAINGAVDALVAEYMDDIINNAYQDPAAAPLMDLYMMLSGYEALLSGLSSYNMGIYQIGTGASALSRGMTKFTDGLDEYKDGLKEYFEGVEEFYDGTGELVDGVYKLADGSRELLDGVIELRDGALEFRDGVIEMRDGVIELFDGIVELHNGVIELRDGVIELNDGVIELYDGTVELRDAAAEFRDGIGDLLDGTRELFDGVAELKDGTGEIRENTQSLDTDIVDGIKDTVNDMMGGDSPVVSFVSEENGIISAVQFLMQTESIARPEAPKPAEPEIIETTFRQRFLSLFGV